MTPGERDIPAQLASGPAIGILIPTFNRIATLKRCLEHLEAQTTLDFEVIVIDDGSSDDTQAELERYRSIAPFPFLSLSQSNAGPARARNLGIARMSAPVCILIGDDTFPLPDFVERHRAFHAAHLQLEVVAIGLTRWQEKDQKVTPLMRWLGSEGEQFNFRELLEGAQASWRHFYTSNLSAKTAYLRENPFNETFKAAGAEDIELGYRLATEKGLQVTFLRDAITEHLHPTSFAQSCRRSIVVGEAGYRLQQLWPVFAIHSPSGLKGVLLKALVETPSLLAAFALVARIVTSVHCPNPLLTRALHYHFLLGYNRAARSSVRQSW